MSDAGDIYGERGFGGRQGVGRHPALVVIDLNYGFTDPASPLHCDTDAAVQATARLLDAARNGGRPVTRQRWLKKKTLSKSPLVCG